jgi:hypothetical protein
MGRWRSQEELCDRYLLGPVTSVSAKLRHGVLDVKRLIERTADFERWQPAWSREAPFPMGVVDGLLVEIGAGPASDDGRVAAEKDHRRALAEPQLVELFEQGAATRSASVTKTRRRYRLGAVRAESTRVRVEGTTSPVWTVAIEHTDLEQLAAARASLGLEAAENVSVNVALSRGRLRTGEITGGTASSASATATGRGPA